MLWAIVVGQKPTEGSNLDNIIKYKVCLVNTNATTGDNMFPCKCNHSR